MAFQFMCPQGHVLQGDEAHAGQAVQCPQCGTMFVIPSPGSGAGTPAQTAPAAPAPPPVEQEAADEGFPILGRRGGRFSFLEEQESASHDPYGGAEPMPDIATGDGPQSVVHDPFGGSSPRKVTIPCPNGHQLTTLYDSMGQEILCPQCGEQFVLSYTNSLEYHREVEEKQAAHEHKIGNQWLTWAVVAAVAVAIRLICLVVATSE